MRLAAAWAAKRTRNTNEKINSKCVGWLKLAEDRTTEFDFIPERAQIVRRIFEMASKGHGANGITKTLSEREESAHLRKAL